MHVIGHRVVGRRLFPSGIAISLALLLLNFFASPALCANYLVVWGQNYYGQLSPPAGLTNVISLSSGTSDSQVDSCITSDGHVVVWGCCSSRTMIPAGVSNVTTAASGYTQMLGLKNNGSVMAWGDNPYGELNVPANLTNAMMIAAGSYHCLALRSNGTVAAWGYPDSRIAVPSNLTNVISIGASFDNSLALKADGTLVMWGPVGVGTTPPANLTNVAAISGTFLALKKDGGVVAWGDSSGQMNPPLGLTNIVAIAGNGGHNLALKSNGTIVAWGYGPYGETNIPPGMSNVTAIAVSGNTSLAIVTRNDGAPVVTSHPSSQTIYSGASVTFTASAQGLPAPGYQWQLNSTNLPGANGSSLTITNCQLANSGLYHLIATNSLGSARSLDATLTVNLSSPIIVFPPQNQTVIAGTTATLAMPFPADGSLPLSYQWQFNNSNIPGATNASLVLPNVQTSNAGNFRLVITNPYGRLASSNAYLTVIDLGTALSAPDLTWITGGNQPWLPIYSVNQNANYAYVARSGAITNNQTSALHTSVTGPGQLSFWWHVSSQPVVDYLSFTLDGVEQARVSGQSGWQSQTYYLGTGVHNLTWQYAKGASGSGGQDAAFLDAVSYTVGVTFPGISNQPASQATPPGSNVLFSVSAFGTPPLNYQWQRNGTNLIGATNSFLVLTNVQLGDSGAYRVEVNNDYNSVTSSNANLNVFLFVGAPQPQDALDRWYFRNPGLVNRVRFAGNLFFGLGPNGLLLTSPDGAVWTAQNSGSTNALLGVAYGTLLPSNLYVVVGGNGTILTSSNGINWRSIVTTSQNLNDVAWNGNNFVAVATASSAGQPNVFYSANGTSWSGSSFPSNPDTGFPFACKAIGVSGGYFITAGGSMFADYIWRSANGSSWQNVGFSDAVVNAIAQGHGTTIVVGLEGWPRVSIDQGASWFPSVTSTNSYPDVVNDVAFGNNTFLVARGYGFFTTQNGTNWNSRNPFSDANTYSIAYGNGTFVAAYAGGTYPSGIYQSAPVNVPIITFGLQTVSHTVTLGISGAAGQTYRVQSSSNLQAWADCYIYTNSGSVIQFTDTFSPFLPEIFYRVKSP